MYFKSPARSLLANVSADLLRTERAGNKREAMSLRRTMRDPRSQSVQKCRRADNHRVGTVGHRGTDREYESRCKHERSDCRLRLSGTCQR